NRDDRNCGDLGCDAHVASTSSRMPLQINASMSPVFPSFARQDYCALLDPRMERSGSASSNAVPFFPFATPSSYRACMYLPSYGPGEEMLMDPPTCAMRRPIPCRWAPT